MRNPDGTFTLVFGYMSRNYEEEPGVPVGAENFFEPGPADRGQPDRRPQPGDDRRRRYASIERGNQ